MIRYESNLHKVIDGNSTNLENSVINMVSSNDNHKKTELEQLKEEIKNELRKEFETMISKECTRVMEELYCVIKPTKCGVGYLFNKLKYLDLRRHGETIRDSIITENLFYLDDAQIKKFEAMYCISKPKISKKKTPSEIKKERLSEIYKLLVDRQEHFTTTTEITNMYKIHPQTSNRYFLELKTTRKCVICRNSKNKNVLTLFLNQQFCSTVLNKI